MLLSLWSALFACYDNGFAIVSTAPIYGCVDGCEAIRISGHGFSKDATATVGGNAVTGIEWPARELDQGYFITGIMPASSNGKGYADVVVKSGGESSTLTSTAAYYYVECPGAGHVDYLSAQSNIAAGDVIEIHGCGLDVATQSVRIVDGKGTAVGADIPLTATCGTAVDTFTAPTVSAGGYYFELVDSAGEILSGAPCLACDPDEICDDDPATCPDAEALDTASSCSDFPLFFGEEGC